MVNRIEVNRIEVNRTGSIAEQSIARWATLQTVEIKRGDTMGTELGGGQFSLVRVTALHDS